MEPRIQYAQTADGASIAFWTMGEGMPLVLTPSAPPNPTQRVMQTPEGRRWIEGLSERRQLIRYDNRGFGNSARTVAGHSLDALVLDLESVVDRLALDRFALFGYLLSGPVAIAYAARHPQRVSHLILWCTSAAGSDLFGTQNSALSRVAEEDWELYTDAFALLVFGWSASEQARRYAAALRESATRESLRAALEAIAEIDVTDLLSDMRCPTLVLQRHKLETPSVEAARSLAAKIPGAELVVLEGESAVPYVGDTEAVLQAIDGYVGHGEEVAADSKEAEQGTLRTVLFTDVEGSTALTQRLGDAKARALLREHERIVREALRSHSGSEVKTMGDGFMASFGSATQALECAIAVQRAFAEHNESAEEPIRVRVGLNAGEPIAEEEDLFGTAVIRAARIAAMAQGGEILVANVVRELAEGKDFLFADRGETALRGFDDPVRLFEVRWQREG